MKVMGINASPRKKANTPTLVETILNGAAEQGAQTRLFNLRELDINGCMGCEGCKKQLGKCVQRDDLKPLLQAMAAFDAIVLVTPVYWYHVAAQFKMLVDHLYSFIEISQNPETGEETFASHFPAGRNLIIVISRSDVEPPPILSQLYDDLNEWLKLIPLSLNCDQYEIFHPYEAHLDRAIVD